MSLLRSLVQQGQYSHTSNSVLVQYLHKATRNYVWTMVFILSKLGKKLMDLIVQLQFFLIILVIHEKSVTLYMSKF